MSLFRIASILVLWEYSSLPAFRPQQEVLFKSGALGQKLPAGSPPAISLLYCLPFCQKADLKKTRCLPQIGSPDGRIQDGSGSLGVWEEEVSDEEMDIVRRLGAYPGNPPISATGRLSVPFWILRRRKHLTRNCRLK